MFKLSILIPSTFDREEMLMSLMKGLYEQIQDCKATNKVEIITDVDNRELTIGMKRNLLLLKARGEYVVFIDSDDEVSNDYISEILNAIKLSPDVISFNGYITTNGNNLIHFKIAKDLPYIRGQDGLGNMVYLRYCNHLCPIKREIALQIMFPDVRFAEDYEYATKLKNSGLLKEEVIINKELYHYKYITQKT